MIRAINKRILEVQQNNDTCFEKALLFLKPNYLNDDYSMIKSAENYINYYNNKMKKAKYKKQFLFSLSRFIIGYLLGLTTFAIISFIF